MEKSICDFKMTKTVFFHDVNVVNLVAVLFVVKDAGSGRLGLLLPSSQGTYSV